MIKRTYATQAVFMLSLLIDLVLLVHVEEYRDVYRHKGGDLSVLSSQGEVYVVKKDTCTSFKY